MSEQTHRPADLDTPDVQCSEEILAAAIGGSPGIDSRSVRCLRSDMPMHTAVRNMQPGMPPCLSGLGYCAVEMYGEE